MYFLNGLADFLKDLRPVHGADITRVSVKNFVEITYTDINFLQDISLADFETQTFFPISAPPNISPSKDKTLKRSLSVKSSEF